jgi:hypothetical protein
MISMLHQSGRVGHGRPEHSGTSGVKNRLIKSGAAFGGGGKIGSKTMKAQSVEAKDKEKEQIVKKKKRKGFLELRGLA